MRAILQLAGFSALAGTLAGPLAGVASAEELAVSVELPKISVAEYHKPYVAVWIARADHSVAANLAVWYQQEDGPEGKGETWLKDMRQWWRRSGRKRRLRCRAVPSLRCRPWSVTRCVPAR